MFNAQSLFAAAALVLVSGCATLQEVPPPTPRVSAGCPTGAELAAAPGQQRILCGIVDEITDQAAVYQERYASVSRTRAGVQTVGLAAALAGAGFVAFDAHNDNVKAAGLIAGGSSIINNSVGLNARVDIFRSGVSALTCYADVGNTFANAYVNGLNGTSTAAQLEDTIRRLGVALNDGRARLTETPPDVPAAERAEFTNRLTQTRAALTDALTRGAAAYEGLAKARRAFVEAPSSLQNAWVDTDRRVNARLVGARPNLESIIQQLQTLNQKLDGPATPPASPKPPAASANSGRDFIQTVQDAVSELEQYIQVSQQLNADYYVLTFQRIATCKALAEG